MSALALTLALLTTRDQADPSTGIVRDSFGVALVRAASANDAFRLMGRAVAEDRLWQMELSRRSARGRLAEILGPTAVAGDTQTLLRGYTDDEYAEMLRRLPAEAQSAFNAYAQGVNETITARAEAGTLPPQYAELGFAPAPWTPTDSAAIAVSLARRFGQGGAGELRNYALFQYLRTRPGLRGRELAAFDDLAWQNDPRAIPTVPRNLDIVFDPPKIWDFTQADSQRHIDALPPTSLLELAPAVRLASFEDATLLAESLGVPHKVGSYAVAIAPRRSRNRSAMLLAAPQMGHTVPNVVHEIALDAPGLQVAGMNVPGIPGVLIGYTPHAAWAFTSGVADLEDVFVSRMSGDETYMSSGKEQTLERITFTLPVKGAEARTVVQERTLHGPVLLRSRASQAVYSLKSPYWQRELAGVVGVLRLAHAKAPADFSLVASNLPVTFNLFFATRRGDIGYRFAGLVPIRAQGLDPRFPTPDEERFQWRGFVPVTKMPRLDNPATGFIANWNNKPAHWWPNGDTPAWGRVFRNTDLLAALPTGEVSGFDLERAAWTIARRETDTSAAFVPYFRDALAKTQTPYPTEARLLSTFDGWRVDNSAAALLYDRAVAELRRTLFSELFGNFTSDDLFARILQPHVILEALDGKSRVLPLSAFQRDERLVTAFSAAVASLRREFGPVGPRWSLTPSSMPAPEGPRIPFSERGTYIQITELGDWPSARAVASPGVAETGRHSGDQADLARSWRYKPLWGWE